MYRRILVATDLTEGSAPALRTALSLGRELGAHVTAMYVTEPPYEPRRWLMPVMETEAEFFRNIAKREQDAAQRVLEDQVREATIEPTNGATVDTLVRTGTPAELIPATARELGADIIVMGTHGRQGLQLALLGSIAERVVRTAPCPVLTVRADASETR